MDKTSETFFNNVLIKHRFKRCVKREEKYFMENNMSVFGQRLKELRKERGQKQTEMATFLDLTEAHYQKWSMGKLRNH